VIKIACVETGKLKCILRGHHDLIHDICWSFDDTFLATASADGSAKLWDLKDIE